jgi:hypothetical protein
MLRQRYLLMAWAATGAAEQRQMGTFGGPGGHPRSAACPGLPVSTIVLSILLFSRWARTSLRLWRYPAGEQGPDSHSSPGWKEVTTTPAATGLQ